MTPIGASSAAGPPAADDAALVAAAAGGDARAWRGLIERYSALVYSVLVRYGLDEPDREDVFQEVFVSLLGRISSLRDPQALPKWLITTTHRLAWKSMKHSGREPLLAHQPLEEQSPPLELVLQWERQHFVRQALSRLAGRCEQLLSLLYLESRNRSGQPDYQDIARRLDMPVGSIGPTRGRCMAKLVEILNSMGFDDAL